jgi:hypothetical protein
MFQDLFPLPVPKLTINVLLFLFLTPIGSLRAQIKCLSPYTRTIILHAWLYLLPEEGASRFLLNIGKHLAGCKTIHRRRYLFMDLPQGHMRPYASCGN